MKSHPPTGQYTQLLSASPEITELGIIGRESLRHLLGRCDNIDNIIRALRTCRRRGPARTPSFTHSASTTRPRTSTCPRSWTWSGAAWAQGSRGLRITESEVRVFPQEMRTRVLELEMQGLEVQFKREHERWLARGLLEYV
jgi:hypothetical protein